MCRSYITIMYKMVTLIFVLFVNLVSQLSCMKYETPKSIAVVSNQQNTNTDILSFENSRKKFHTKNTFRNACFGQTCIMLVETEMLNDFNSTFGADNILSISHSGRVQTFDTEVSCVKQTAQRPQIWHLNRINNRMNNVENESFTYSLHDNGQGVTVYVIDSGVNINHTEFEGRASFGFIGEDAALDGTADDLSGHGTHVAGLICSRLYGVAKACDIVSVKVIGQNGYGSEMDIVLGLQYVYEKTVKAHTVNGKAFKVVCNLSFGTYDNALGMEAAVKELHAIGILLVTASGNENRGACKATPGKMSEVLNVGATDQLDKLTTFSNWGSCVDILAPGKDIASTGYLNETAETILDGTSFSAPIVTGAVARYLSKSKYPIPIDEIKSYLGNGATRDVIDLVDDHKASTPNVLLFVNCTEKVVEEQDNTTETDNERNTARSITTDNSALNRNGIIGIAVGIFGLIAIGII